MTAESALKRMHGSLVRWLATRAKNDARGVLESDRLDRARYEPILAARLRELLRKLHPDATLPYDAVALARIATGQASLAVDSPSAQGILPLGLIIIAGAVLVISQAVSSYADYAEERERIRCIESGACTDYGFWLKWAAIGVGAWFVWNKTNAFDRFKRPHAA